MFSQLFKIKKYFLKNNKNNKGFALLIAVVVASVLISITYLMFSISLKQLTLSTTGKNSQIALYAADSGIECALFADNKINDFVTATPSTDGKTLTLSQPNPMDHFLCNGLDIGPAAGPTSFQVKVGGVNTPYTVDNNDPNNKAETATFYVHTQDDEAGPCAFVTVSKYVVKKDNTTTERLATKIESRGYNTCPTNNPTDPLRLERGLEVYY